MLVGVLLATVIVMTGACRGHAPLDGPQRRVLGLAGECAQTPYFRQRNHACDTLTSLDDEVVRGMVMALVDGRCAELNYGPIKLLVLLSFYRSRTNPWRQALVVSLERWRTGDWEISAAAALGLEFLGDQGAEAALIDALAQPYSWSVALQAARALARMPSLGARARTMLAHVSEHYWSPDVRLAATEALQLSEDGQGYRDVDTRLGQWRLGGKPLVSVAAEIDPVAERGGWHHTESACARFGPRGQTPASWFVKWRGATLELSPADDAEKVRHPHAVRCSQFREQCEVAADVELSTVGLQGWERVIAPERFVHSEFGSPLYNNLYERIGKRCQRWLELPGHPLRWKSVDGALIVVTKGGALAISADKTIEPVQCM